MVDMTAAINPAENMLIALASLRDRNYYSYYSLCPINDVAKIQITRFMIRLFIRVIFVPVSDTKKIIIVGRLTNPNLSLAS